MAYEELSLKGNQQRHFFELSKNFCLKHRRKAQPTYFRLHRKLGARLPGLRAVMDESVARMLTSLDRPGGAVAQLGARLDGIEEVVGSNPIGSTI